MNKIETLQEEIEKIKRFLGMIPTEKSEYELEIEKMKEELRNGKKD